MPAPILATGTGAGNSGDIAIAPGTIVCLKGVTAAVFVTIQIKDDEGNYSPAGTMSDGNQTLVFNGGGVFKFTRQSGTCGIFSG